jgi:glycerophosphoryl diester phosphodiesterase
MGVLIQNPKSQIQNLGPRPLIIGHRGASGDAPENTLAAFDLAMAQNADGIEFDVHLSKDGVPVVIHDFTLKRTTSGRGRVRDHTAAELKRLDAGSWFNRRFPGRADPSYAGESIPTLAETLTWVRANHCLAYLEIKQGRVPYPGIAERVMVEIRSAGLASLVTVISFRSATIRQFRRLQGEIAAGLDCTRPLAAIQMAKSVGARTVLPHWRFAGPRFIARAHRAGLAVVVWGLDDREAMGRKLTQGMDGIITGYPGRLRSVWGEMRKERA